MLQWSSDAHIEQTHLRLGEPFRFHVRLRLGCGGPRGRFKFVHDISKAGGGNVVELHGQELCKRATPGAHETRKSYVPWRGGLPVPPRVLALHWLERGQILPAQRDSQLVRVGRYLSAAASPDAPVTRQSAAR